MTRNRILCALGFALLSAAAAASPAADDAALTRMVTCRDSWLDWQTAGDPRLPRFAAQLHAGYAAHGNDAYVLPRTRSTVAGLPVLQLYPNSVGMGVGISVLVAAPFDAARKAIEQNLGRPLAHCATEEGMTSCELQISEKRTVTLMQDDPKDATTLVACYYYYER
ncbi:MAG: hypothetical protein WDM91_05290 [Rhizomicrobium sp.]